jgi:hypothetical protein
VSAVNAVALLAAAGGDYQISRSVRTRQSASAYFNRTAGVAPTSNQKGTFSFWIKRGATGPSNGSFLLVQAVLAVISELMTSLELNTLAVLILFQRKYSVTLRLGITSFLLLIQLRQHLQTEPNCM